MRAAPGTTTKRTLKEDHERDWRTVSVVENNTKRMPIRTIQRGHQRRFANAFMRREARKPTIARVTHVAKKAAITKPYKALATRLSMNVAPEPDHVKALRFR